MRILFVTPGITYFPASMGNSDSYLVAKADGVTDSSTHLVAALAQRGLEVHVAMPNYRRIIKDDHESLAAEDLRIYKNHLPDAQIHLADDPLFDYRSVRDEMAQDDNASIAFSFQREVMERVIPKVMPDLIHCNDWLTGLIPAAARTLPSPIPCLLTLHNMHTHKSTLTRIEDYGVNVTHFWRGLFFQRMPYTYEEAKADNPVDLLSSAIFGAHFIHTGSPTFFEEIAAGRHNFLPGNIVAESTNKKHAGCAVGIPLPISPDYDPKLAEHKYDTENACLGKRTNKIALQSKCGLERTASAPLFFWPSRLDAQQKGCHLLTDILYETVDRFWNENLQIVIVANGVYKKHFEDIVRMHNLSSRVAVTAFSEYLAKLAYAGSDFLLAPSLYEPCGLTAMTGLIFGTLPICYDTGGLHDTVKSLRVESHEGNGILFQKHTAQSLRGAIEQAMNFHRLPDEKKGLLLSRIMKESQKAFHMESLAGNYIDLYKKMLDRPMVKSF